MRNIPIIVITVLIIGCATSQPANSEKLAAEVNSIIRNEMLSSQAQIGLSKHGFVCKEGTGYDPNRKGIYECSRSRGGWALYSCIHRVWFEAESADSPISNIKIHKPFCMSL